MCGRYTLSQTLEAIREAFGVAERPNIPPRYNVAPTDTMPVVRLDHEGGRKLVTQRWGLVPFWAKDLRIGAKMINARAESVAEKPPFREAFERRRCLVPADGFYEWRTVGEGKQAVKQPHWIGFADRRLFAFAGLWASWRDGQGERIESFSIVTTDANELVQAIHPRMPVILDAADYPVWLEGESQAAAALLKPHDPAEMAVHRVGLAVNKVANDDETLLAPVEDGDERPAQGTLL